MQCCRTNSNPCKSNPQNSDYLAPAANIDLHLSNSLWPPAFQDKSRSALVAQGAEAQPQMSHTTQRKHTLFFQVQFARIKRSSLRTTSTRCFATHAYQSKRETIGWMVGCVDGKRSGWASSSCWRRFNSCQACFVAWLTSSSSLPTRAKRTLMTQWFHRDWMMYSKSGRSDFTTLKALVHAWRSTLSFKRNVLLAHATRKLRANKSCVSFALGEFKYVQHEWSNQIGSHWGLVKFWNKSLSKHPNVFQLALTWSLGEVDLAELCPM